MAPPTIAQLLEASRRAHEDYRANLTRSQPGPAGQAIIVEGDPILAALALARAAGLRSEAYQRDPECRDPAWVIDDAQTGGRHTLHTWYAEMVGRGDEPVFGAAREHLMRGSADLHVEV